MVNILWNKGRVLRKTFNGTTGGVSCSFIHKDYSNWVHLFLELNLWQLLNCWWFHMSLGSNTQPPSKEMWPRGPIVYQLNSKKLICDKHATARGWRRLDSFCNTVSFFLCGLRFYRQMVQNLPLKHQVLQDNMLTHIVWRSTLDCASLKVTYAVNGSAAHLTERYRLSPELHNNINLCQWSNRLAAGLSLRRECIGLYGWLQDTTVSLCRLFV